MTPMTSTATAAGTGIATLFIFYFFFLYPDNQPVMRELVAIHPFGGAHGECSEVAVLGNGLGEKVAMWGSLLSFVPGFIGIVEGFGGTS